MMKYLLAGVEGDHEMLIFYAVFVLIEGERGGDQKLPTNVFT